MSRNHLLRLFCRFPAGSVSQPQCASYFQATADYSAAYSKRVLGSRLFSASADQSPVPQDFRLPGLARQFVSDSTALVTEKHSEIRQLKVPRKQYSCSGAIDGPYVVKRKPVFAVVELGPTQFKVTPDDLVYSEKLKGVDVGDQVSLHRVLLLGNKMTTIIGRPCVPGATVTAVVEV